MCDESRSDSSSQRPKLVNNISELFREMETTRTLAAAYSSREIDFLSKVDLRKVSPTLLQSNTTYIEQLASLSSEKLEDVDNKHETYGLQVQKQISSPRFIDIQDDGRDILGEKLKEVFQCINFRKDDKIIVDLVQFIAGLRLLGLVEIEEKEIGEVFKDFVGDEAGEVDIESIISNLHKSKTYRIRTLKNLLTDILGITTPVVQHERVGSKDNEISLLRSTLDSARTKYKSDLFSKSTEIDSLGTKLKESEETNIMLKDQLRQKLDKDWNLAQKEIKKLNEELTTLKRKHFDAENQYYEKVEKLKARVMKYKAKYENLQEKMFKTNAREEMVGQEAPFHRRPHRNELPLCSDNSSDHKHSPKSAELSKVNEKADSKDISISGISVGMNSNVCFSKLQELVACKSGVNVCITVWRFLINDLSQHSIRLKHVHGPVGSAEEVDSDGVSRRVIHVDDKEHYNKKSNAKKFLFQINADEVLVSIRFDSIWRYKLTINGQPFQIAYHNFYNYK